VLDRDLVDPAIFNQIEDGKQGNNNDNGKQGAHGIFLK
jgi:hypothetical protein